MEDGDSSSRSDSLSGIVSERVKRLARQPNASVAVDEEGTEDVWKDCIKRLHKTKEDKRGIEIDIEEANSIDWRAERTCLPQYLTQVEQQHAFIPRLGELVLWCPTFLDNHHLMRDPDSGEYKFYSFDRKRFQGFPAWRGGVIASMPSASAQNGPLDFFDILDTPNKKTSFNTAGFRVETMPDPNDDTDKSLSKQYRYVPLRNIRPLSHWQLLLKGIPQAKLHPSIIYALTLMTSLSLIEKWRFNGDWPNATIFAKGCYVGSELLTIGDTIRFRDGHAHDAKPLRTHIMVVDSIRLRIRDCQTDQAQISPVLGHHTFITFVGKAYTNDLYSAHGMPDRSELRTADTIMIPQAVPLETVKSVFRPVGTAEYGRWYRMHGENSKYEISYDFVLGRLYEADAVRLWAGQRQSLATDKTNKPIPDLNYDTASIIAGRTYATQADERIPETTETAGLQVDHSKIRWLISDTRAQSLTIASINGLEVGPYHEIRTPSTNKAWRANVKVASGTKPEGEVLANMMPWKNVRSETVNMDSLFKGKPRGRPPGSRLINGKIVRAEDLDTVLKTPDSSGAVAAGYNHHDKDDEDEEEEDDGDDFYTKKSSSQMAGAALLSTDEEELNRPTRRKPSRNHSLMDSDAEEEYATPESRFDSDRGGESSEALTLAQEASARPGGRYNSSDEASSADENESEEAVEDVTMEDWQEANDASKGPQGMSATKHAKRRLTKAEIMRSVAGIEDGADIDNDLDEYTSEDENWNEDWAAPRFARGGTEESEGGDYVP